MIERCETLIITSILCDAALMSNSYFTDIFLSQLNLY